MEQQGWDQPGFDDTFWSPVDVTRQDTGMVAQMMEPIRVLYNLPARSWTEPAPGVYIFDFEQNIVGRVRLIVRGKTGDRIILRHAEALTPDGNLYATMHRGAAQKDEYILRGDTGGEVLEPLFTYHGFRYVEVTGLNEPPELSDVQGIVFNSSSPHIGMLTTSNPRINRLWENILWTQRGNMMSVFTDCPQRDERLGWLGDYQVFAPTACFNMQMASFINKTARDMRLAQAQDGNMPVIVPNVLSLGGGSLIWGAACLIVPWVSYIFNADYRLLEEHYQCAKKWGEWVQRQSKDNVLIARSHQDHVNGDSIQMRGWPKEGATASPEVIGTGYFAYTMRLLNRMAETLGRKDEAAHYKSHYESIRKTFQHHFIDLDGRMKDDTQGAYAIALHFDLVPESLREKMAGHLVEAINRYQGHLSTGFVFTHMIMLELSRSGRNDVAWKLINQRKPPSWGYMIDQGATTIWERWDSYIDDRKQSDFSPNLQFEMQTPILPQFQITTMNSFNHAPFGAVGEWLYRVVLGLEPSETGSGFSNFTIHPKPGEGVSFAKGEVQTVRGTVAVNWKIEDGVFHLGLVVPPNTTAIVILPAASVERITEGGMPLSRATGVTILDAGRLKVASGKYEFKCLYIDHAG